MKIEIITVGNEVLRDETSENNASWLARRLTDRGFTPSRITSLPDDRKILAEEIRQSRGRSEMVIVTGGLGPTADDVTRQAAIEAWGGEVDIRPRIVESIRARFLSEGLELPGSYQDLSRVPRGARILPNTVGAAPGLRMKSASCDLILLPGVPAEMREIFNRFIYPDLTGSSGSERTVLSLFGMGETSAQEKLQQVFNGEEMEEISIIAGPAGITIYFPQAYASSARMNALDELFGSYLYARERRSLEKTVLELLLEGEKTVAVAESITGGLLCSTLISVPGASRAFREGFIAYSNEAKVLRLGVDAGLIEREGAVSGGVCVSMARGARERAGTDFALSTTGIAGPTGATAMKAVGLCFIGLAGAGEVYCHRIRFPGDRQMVRARTAATALDMLRLRLSGALDRLEQFRVRED
ncbi:MAG: nicotinamide-nucleotide amidohydrolase family protein [Candidatus Krumholzibacteriota bacterium]|nr:nicotinamide-nucleotide amidohydrolase family protein [Candidatus Krumholzibacteriota bacterium]